MDFYVKLNLHPDHHEPEDEQHQESDRLFRLLEERCRTSPQALDDDGYLREEDLSPEERDSIVEIYCQGMVSLVWMVRVVRD